MNRYLLSAQAIDDLQDIWDYLALEKENPSAAHRQVELLYRKFTMLAQNPWLGEGCDSLRPGLRFFTAEKYVVFYVAKADCVEIERVIHGARDIGLLFGKS
jgi:toxin ParE1/3/4